MAQASKPLADKVTLLGLLPVQALLSQLDAGFVAEPAERAALQAQWERANRSYSSLQPSRSFSTADDVRPLAGVDASKVEKMLARIRNYAPYDSHPTDVFNVRIAKLVTPQLTINLARANRRANVRKDMSPTELFDLAFQSAGTPEPITRQALGIGPNGGALLFTSYDEDIRLHHPPQFRNLAINEADTASPRMEDICFPVGGGLPFAAARRVKIAPGITRLILGNGIHRVYRLAAEGFEWCPLLLTDMTPLEIPDPFVDLQKDILLNPGSNPPLITDFVSPDLAIHLKYYKVLKTVRFNWNFEQYVTVLK